MGTESKEFLLIQAGLFTKIGALHLTECIERFLAFLFFKLNKSLLKKFSNGGKWEVLEVHNPEVMWQYLPGQSAMLYAKEYQWEETLKQYNIVDFTHWFYILNEYLHSPTSTFTNQSHNTQYGSTHPQRNGCSKVEIKPLCGNTEGVNSSAI